MFIGLGQGTGAVPHWSQWSAPLDHPPHHATTCHHATTGDSSILIHWNAHRSVGLRFEWGFYALCSCWRVNHGECRTERKFKCGVKVLCIPYLTLTLPFRGSQLGDSGGITKAAHGSLVMQQTAGQGWARYRSDVKRGHAWRRRGGVKMKMKK